MVEVPVKIQITNILKKARESVRQMTQVSGAAKTKALNALAGRIEAKAEELVDANRADAEAIGKSLAGTADKDVIKAAVERVRFPEGALADLVMAIRDIANRAEPVGEVTHLWRQPNGMDVCRMRVPLGLIGIVSDGGPLQTTDLIALCLKAGNVCVVRGGPEWVKSGAMVSKFLLDSAAEAGLPAGAITIVDRTEKEAALELIKSPLYLDALIPRGGPGLRKTAKEQARVPVLCHGIGVSHVYVDVEADLPLAQNVVINSKAQQARATNAVDTLLVHQSISRQIVPALIRRLLDEFKVDVLGCPKTISMIGSMNLTGYRELRPVTDEDWGKQFLTSTLALKIVKDMDEALDHIAAYGPSHTDTIVTRDYATAMRFVQDVDAGAVLVNASTRMHDAAEFGLGSEVGVGTGRLHARGSLSLEALTCEKYVVFGTGQLRQPHPVPVTYEDAIMLKRPS